MPEKSVFNVTTADNSVVQKAWVDLNAIRTDLLILIMILLPGFREILRVFPIRRNDELQ